MIDVKKEIIAKHENGVRVSDLATQFGTAKSTICTILKNRETIKKADVARVVTVITKQRSQTSEEEVKNLCTKYCCKSWNKQSSGVQERINPFYINFYGENSFGLRTFRFTNDLQEWIKFVIRGLTIICIVRYIRTALRSGLLQACMQLIAVKTRGGHNCNTHFVMLWNFELFMRCALRLLQVLA